MPTAVSPIAATTLPTAPATTAAPAAAPTDPFSAVLGTAVAQTQAAAEPAAATVDPTADDVLADAFADPRAIDQNAVALAAAGVLVVVPGIAPAAPQAQPTVESADSAAALPVAPRPRAEDAAPGAERLRFQLAAGVQNATPPARPVADRTPKIQPERAATPRAEAAAVPTPATIGAPAATPANPLPTGVPAARFPTIPAQAPVVTGAVIAPVAPVPVPPGEIVVEAADAVSALPDATIGDRPSVAGERFVALATAGARLAAAPPPRPAVPFADVIQDAVATVPAAAAPVAPERVEVPAATTAPAAPIPAPVAGPVAAAPAAVPNATPSVPVPVAARAPVAAPKAVAPVAANSPEAAPEVNANPARVEAPPAVEPPVAATAHVEPRPVAAPRDPAPATPSGAPVPDRPATNLDRVVTPTTVFANVAETVARRPVVPPDQPREPEARPVADAAAAAPPVTVPTAPQTTDAPPPVARPAAAAPAVAVQVADGVVAHARTLAATGEVEFRLRLDPPDLGRVRVNLVGSGDQVRGELVVADDAVRRMIESQLPELRQRLEAVGVTVGRFDVTTESAGGGTGSMSRDGDANRPAPPEPPPAPVPRQTRPWYAAPLPTGGLDVTV